MTMDYTSLEEAYGSPFGQRAPVTHARKDIKEQPIAKPEFTSLEQKAERSVRKNQSVIDQLKDSLPLDTSPATETFRVYDETPAPVKQRMAIRETFAGSQPAGVYDLDQSEKLARILRLIEQNKTGYERPAIQDMILYISTGIFFLFTFDTFVMLGKSMRGK